MIYNKIFNLLYSCFLIPLFLFFYPSITKSQSPTSCNFCSFDLSIRAKGTKSQLIWSHDGSESYRIMRSTESATEGFVEIGSTSSTYSTYLDNNIDLNQDYWYQIENQQGCYSIPVHVYSPGRIRNGPPVIQSTPPENTNAGEPFEYVVSAIDPENNNLTYYLDIAHQDMIIDPYSGQINWTPPLDLAGSNECVLVRVSDTYNVSDQQFFNLKILVNVIEQTSGTLGNGNEIFEIPNVVEIEFPEDPLRSLNNITMKQIYSLDLISLLKEHLNDQILPNIFVDYFIKVSLEDEFLSELAIHVNVEDSIINVFHDLNNDGIKLDLYLLDDEGLVAMNAVFNYDQKKLSTTISNAHFFPDNSVSAFIFIAVNKKGSIKSNIDCNLINPDPNRYTIEKFETDMLNVKADLHATVPDFKSPLSNPFKTSGFLLGGHGGIDLRATVGTPLFAVEDGVVFRIEKPKKLGATCRLNNCNHKIDLGNRIYIRSNIDDNFASRYCHLDTVFVKVGDIVTLGDQIGETGDSGHTHGAHLHFDYYGSYPNSLRIDPEPFIFGSSTASQDYLKNLSTQIYINHLPVSGTKKYFQQTILHYDEAIDINSLNLQTNLVHLLEMKLESNGKSINLWTKYLKICDLTGDWDVTETCDETSCGGSISTTSSVTNILQNGQNITITSSTGVVYQGSLSTPTIGKVSATYNDGSGVTTETSDFTVNSWGDIITSVTNWVYNEGSFSCQGSCSAIAIKR